MITQRKYDALVAENQELKSKLETILGARLPGRATTIKAGINKIKADAITQAVVDVNVTPAMGSDVMGTVRVTDLLEYASKLENGE